MGEEPDAIRADIEETRARMGERAEALAYKADVPARSKDKVHDVTDTIKEKVTSVTDKVTGKAHDATSTVSDKASGLTGAVSDKAHGVTDTVADKAHGVADKASSLKNKAKSSGGQKSGPGAAAKVKGIAQTNPLGLAVGAIAAGFLAGLAAPSTKIEQEKLAPVAHKAREQATEKASELQDKVKSNVVEAVVDKVTSSTSSSSSSSS
ncbi:DUF3618 domain-containing protein [Aquipuribacter hungaricus]